MTALPPNAAAGIAATGAPTDAAGALIANDVLIAFSTNTWASPLAHLRILCPANYAGIQVLQGSQEGQIFTEKIAQAGLVWMQRDFPRHGKAYEHILSLARQQGKPLIYDLDDLLLELPGDHPDRLN